MMGNRRRGRIAITIAATGALLALSACAAPTSGGGARSAAPADPGPVLDEPMMTPTSTPRGWPAGADAQTPECQDASAAVLAAANEAIRTAGAETGRAAAPMPWLSAHADEDLGAWTLTGTTSYGPTSESGFFVVLASRDDPTSADFAGELFAVGGSAASTTGLPPLQPGYASTDPMDDVPGSALGCAEVRQAQP
jgi:hypothetical protein